MPAGDWPEPTPALAPRPCRPGRAWVHEGYRIRIEGSGGALQEVAADIPIMTAIQHAPGEAARLSAEGVSLWRDGRGAWLATALDAPLFAWREPVGGTASWRGPAGDWIRTEQPSRRVLDLASRGSGAQVRFEVTSGELHADAERIEWRRDGAGVLVAIAGRDAEDVARALDLLERRGLAGLAGQRARHAEHLVRGGAAAMSDAAAELAEAFEWAKVRADARLGWLLHRAGAATLHDSDVALLAGALLAAGLGDLPRALERLGGAAAAGGCDDFVPAELTAGSTDALAAGTVPPREAARILSGTVGGAWGVLGNAAAGRVVLRPDPARLGTRAALSRVRVGGTVLDLRLRRRGDVVSLSVRRGAGPTVGVDCTIPGVIPGDLLLDDVPLGGASARFELTGAHDVQARLRNDPELSSASS